MIENNVATIVIVSIIIGVCIFLHTWLFVIMGGSQPCGKPYDNFIMQICSPKGYLHFISTVFTWGYFKCSMKMCFRYYMSQLLAAPKAKIGSKCPDMKVISLDGQTLSLLSDYVMQDPSIPLILNMGSYT